MGLILKVDDPGTEETNSGASSDVEDIEKTRPTHDYLGVLRTFFRDFPIRTSLRCTSRKDGPRFKMHLEEETPPIDRPLYKLSPLELDEAKK